MQKRKGVVNSFVVIFCKRYIKFFEPLESVWHAEK